MSSSYNMEVTIDQCWEMNLTSTLQRKPTTYQCMTTNIENQTKRQHKTEFQWTSMSLRDESNTDNQSTHEMKTDTSQSICFVSRDHNPHHGHNQRIIPCTVTLHSQWRCSAGSSRGRLEDLRPRANSSSFLVSERNSLWRVSSHSPASSSLLMTRWPWKHRQA